MAKKLPAGPSWFEVVFGALLSFVLGVVLAASYLILLPVVTVKDLPKEADRVAGAVYFLEGSRDSGRVSRDSAGKRAQFAQGGSISVTEDEINLQIAQPKAPPPPPPAPKKPTGEVVPPLDAKADVSPPNFRIRNGQMQIAVPLKVSAFGLEENIVVISKGTFVRKDRSYVFAPESLSLGSCVLDRLPIVFGAVYEKFIGSQPVPNDIAASWAKLTAVHIEGEALKLVMP